MEPFSKPLILSLLCYTLSACESAQDVKIEGDNKVWHTQTLSFNGPSAGETRTTYTDYRLDVTFAHQDGTTLTVPGYFAADGNASDTSATQGTVWQVKFVPPSAGQWAYQTSFVQGANIAINPSLKGVSAGYFDRSRGQINIRETDLDANATDFRKHGMLSNANARYLKFKGTGQYFIKTGAGSPENMLAYQDFDNTYDVGGTHFPALSENQLHAFDPHNRDARPTDPTWQNGKGGNLLGVVNYLSDVGVNAQYMLLMNVEGDGQDVWPWTSHDTPYVYDVSKLAQWERVFTHMDHNGILKDLLLAETENESWFEITDQTDAEFSDARKVYYREMVARFGHLLGLVWNLVEEHGVDGNSGNEIYRKATTAKQRLAFTDYITELDPYGHAVVSHNWPDMEEETYGPKLRTQNFSGISLQAHDNYGHKVSTWTRKSSEAGHPWIVTIDEPQGWEFGAPPDRDVKDRAKEIKDVLLPALMSGGAGVSWYFGWQNNAPTSDLSNEDMRSRHTLWVKSAELRQWWEQNVPFSEMRWQDDRGSGGALVHENIADLANGAITEVSITPDQHIRVIRKSSSASEIPNSEFIFDPMNLSR